MNSWTQISVAKNSVKNCSQMRSTGLLISETGKIGSKGHWHDCSKQVTLAQLFPSETGAIIPKLKQQDCPLVRQIQLFPSETGTIEIETIFPKWNWHHCYQVTLARLFQRGL